jgi:hypothetical protein
MTDLTNFKPRKIEPIKLWKPSVVETITIGKGEHYPEVISLVELYNPEDLEYPEHYAMVQHKRNQMPHMLMKDTSDKGDNWWWKVISPELFCSLEEVIYTYHQQPNKQLQAYTFLYTYLLITANIDIHKDLGVL